MRAENNKKLKSLRKREHQKSKTNGLGGLEILGLVCKFRLKNPDKNLSTAEEIKAIHNMMDDEDPIKATEVEQRQGHELTFNVDGSFDYHDEDDTIPMMMTDDEVTEGQNKATEVKQVQELTFPIDYQDENAIPMATDDEVAEVSMMDHDTIRKALGEIDPNSPRSNVSKMSNQKRATNKERYGIRKRNIFMIFVDFLLFCYFFVADGSFKTHMTSDGSKKVMGRCDVCAKVFLDVDSIPRHKNIVHEFNKNTHHCQICDYQTSQK